jgi:SnoaL-like domain
MTTTETTSLETAVDTYFAAWNEPDRSKRIALVAAAFIDQCHYVDPLSDVAGHDGIVEMIEGVRAQFAGASLQRTGDIDAHHDVARFSWSATGPDGALIVGGLDVAIVADDGRLGAIAGFFG